jgi:DNA-binding response OmpR family regulator
MKIAVFDDEPDIRTLIEESLKDEGHEILTLAKTPEELERIDECDVLIIDVKAPNDRFAGIKYVIRQRSMNKIRPEAIVIFISSFGRDKKEIKLLLEKTGDYRWLDKPIEIAVLLDIIKEKSRKGKKL